MADPKDIIGSLVKSVAAPPSASPAPNPAAVPPPGFVPIPEPEGLRSGTNPPDVPAPLRFLFGLKDRLPSPHDLRSVDVSASGPTSPSMGTEAHWEQFAKDHPEDSPENYGSSADYLSHLGRSVEGSARQVG